MPNARTAHAITNKKFLMLGYTGSGKTTQFLTLPGKKFAYLFDPNAILSLQGQDVEYEEFLPDKLNLSVKSLSKDKKSDSTTSYQSDVYVAWEKDFNSKVESGFFNQFDCIMLDSATTLLDLIMDRTLTINGRAGQWPQQDDYGPQMNVFTQICRTLTSMNKIVYMTGHLETKKDETLQRMMTTPMMTGRLKTKIPLLFSDIFVCEVENDGRGKVTHKLMTMPDRLTRDVRTSFKGLKPYEDVTIDWKQPLEGQGLGRLIREEKNAQRTLA